MKKKIGTALDEELIKSLKVWAAKEEKTISQVIEEALTDYLRRQRSHSVVERTYGGMKASPETVRAIMEEEEDFLAA